MIFQEPVIALDPVYTLGDQIAEAVVRHEGRSFRDGRAACARIVRSGSHPVAGTAARQLSA